MVSMVYVGSYNRFNQLQILFNLQLSSMCTSGFLRMTPVANCTIMRIIKEVIE